MVEAGVPFIPKALWPYYVKEIAGLDSIQSPQDLESYMSLSLEPVVL